MENITRVDINIKASRNGVTFKRKVNYTFNLQMCCPLDKEQQPRAALAVFFTGLLKGEQVRQPGVARADRGRGTRGLQEEPVRGWRRLEPERRLSRTVEGSGKRFCFEKRWTQVKFLNKVLLSCFRIRTV